MFQREENFEARGTPSLWRNLMKHLEKRITAESNPPHYLHGQEYSLDVCLFPV
jgi:hypothetical protein